jgi:hypothetical protein
MNTSASPSSSSQLKTIVTLFVILRVTILLFYTPQGLLNAYTDYQHYYRVAQLSDQGYYPYLNSWSEHPPLQAYTWQAVYSVVRSFMPAGDLTTPTYQLFARLLGAVMLFFETGALIFLHRIAARAWNLERANWVAWVYALLSLPLFFWNISQTGSVTFFMLLAIDCFLSERYARSAVAVGLGIIIKFTPTFLLGPAARFLWPAKRSIARYLILTLITVGAAYAPFVLGGGTPWVGASLVATGARASWSTPWALLDGNWDVGDVGEVSTRPQIDLATQTYGNPPAIPPIIVLIAFGVLYLWLFLRPIDSRGPRQFIWFTTLTAILFLLWSKGWSPHWVTLVIPLILLSFPTSRGFNLLLWLTLFVFLEWPLSDSLHSPAVFALAILARTALFIVIAVLTARQLWPTHKAPEAVSASGA